MTDAKQKMLEFMTDEESFADALERIRSMSKEEVEKLTREETLAAKMFDMLIHNSTFGEIADEFSVPMEDVCSWLAMLECPLDINMMQVAGTRFFMLKDNPVFKSNVEAGRTAGVYVKVDEFDSLKELTITGILEVYRLFKYGNSISTISDTCKLSPRVVTRALRAMGMPISNLFVEAGNCANGEWIWTLCSTYLSKNKDTDFISYYTISQHALAYDTLRLYEAGYQDIQCLKEKELPKNIVWAMFMNGHTPNEIHYRLMARNADVVKCLRSLRFPILPAAEESLPELRELWRHGDEAVKALMDKGNVEGIYANPDVHFDNKYWDLSWMYRNGHSEEELEKIGLDVSLCEALQSLGYPVPEFLPITAVKSFVERSDAPTDLAVSIRNMYENTDLKLIV